ncbi:MAG: T9SS type A sorting domain-containing protein [Bacteroidetes bacterium]|nr:T9SS type A sorting domain-containing protein [Bacteroidota bacterium]
MKKIIYIILLAYSISAKSQIVWEHTYDSASTDNSLGFGESQLMVIKFEISGERYVKVNRHGASISIYDMNHSLVKTISLVALPLCFGSLGDILYLSEKLFDTDSAIELMYIRSSCGVSSPYYITNIYKEDGTILFSDTGSAQIKPNYEQQQYPIYNTSVGTKMILSYRNGEAKVFSLPGTLSQGVQDGNAQLMQAQGLGNLYPNPSAGKVTLQYELPKGEKEGEIILYNTQGAEVKRYKVDDTFKDLLLDNTMLPAGTYFYQLQTSKGSVGNKKMAVVK